MESHISGQSGEVFFKVVQRSGNIDSTRIVHNRYDRILGRTVTLQEDAAAGEGSICLLQLRHIKLQVYEVRTRNTLASRSSQTHPDNIETRGKKFLQTLRSSRVASITSDEDSVVHTHDIGTGHIVNEGSESNRIIPLV